MDMLNVTDRVEENFDRQLGWLKQLVDDYPSCTDHEKQVEEAASFVDKIMEDDLDFYRELEKDTNNWPKFNITSRCLCGGFSCCRG